jgi:hypothetical protein
LLPLILFIGQRQLVSMKAAAIGGEEYNLPMKYLFASFRVDRTSFIDIKRNAAAGPRQFCNYFIKRRSYSPRVAWNSSSVAVRARCT